MSPDIPSMLPIIQAIPLFASLSAQQHAEIIAGIVMNYYPKDHVFFDEGDVVNENSCMYIIKSGKVQIDKKETFDHYKQVAVLDAGAFFGEMAFVLNEPRNARAITLEECEVFELKKATFTKLMENSPETAAKISQEFMNRLKQNG